MFPKCSRMAAAPDPDSTRPAANAAWLAGLNPAQRQAVLTTEGPVLILAGAGTGKTRALTARLAHILWSRLAWPSEVLAVTFTNKAAREMRHRMEMLVGDVAQGMPYLGTFHAIAARMLRKHAAWRPRRRTPGRRRRSRWPTTATAGASAGSASRRCTGRCCASI